MDMEKKNKIENARIESVGLYYEGRYNCMYVKCVLDGRGWGAQVNIPMEKMKDFVEMFRESITLDDGIFVYELENTPVTVMINDSDKVIAIGDILSTEDEMIKLI